MTGKELRTVAANLARHLNIVLTSLLQTVTNPPGACDLKVAAFDVEEPLAPPDHIGRHNHFQAPPLLTGIEQQWRIEFSLSSSPEHLSPLTRGNYQNLIPADISFFTIKGEVRIATYPPHRWHGV